MQAIFDNDLVNSIKAWILLGDSIVLGIDANDDVRHSRLTNQLSEIGLRDGILSTHPSMSPPATHNRNLNRTPIDAIFVSSNVIVTRAGYAPFDGPHSFQSDHRMLWVELDNISILGKKLPHQSLHLGDKIQSGHPGIRNYYQKQLSKAYIQLQVGHKSRNLQALLQRYSQGEYHLYYNIVWDYNKLHSISRKANKSVSSKFRVMHRGQVSWSPNLQKMRDTINFWTRIVKLRLNVNTSITIIKRLAKQLQLYNGIYVNLHTARLLLLPLLPIPPQAIDVASVAARGRRRSHVRPRQGTGQLEFFQHAPALIFRLLVLDGGPGRHFLRQANLLIVFFPYLECRLPQFPLEFFVRGLEGIDSVDELLQFLAIVGPAATALVSPLGVEYFIDDVLSDGLGCVFRLRLNLQLHLGLLLHVFEVTLSLLDPHAVEFLLEEADLFFLRFQPRGEMRLFFSHLLDQPSVLLGEF